MTRPSPAAAHVVGSAIVVFLPGEVTAQDQEDVCNSLEFSERATRRKFPESEHMKEWEETLFSSLSNLHWFQQSIDIPEKFVEFYDLLKEMKLSDSERKHVGDAITALSSKSENSDALKLFNDRVIINQSLSGALPTDQQTVVQWSADNDEDQIQARYMIVVCSVKHGAVAAKFTSCQFLGQTFVSDVLFPQFHRSTKIRISANTRGLNIATYAPNRDQIKRKLEATGTTTQAKIVLPGDRKY